MEMIETSNQNPKTLGVRLNNPAVLNSLIAEKEYGAVPSTNGFAQFRTYSLGKQAQLRLLRSAMTGRMVPYCRPTLKVNLLTNKNQNDSNQSMDRPDKLSSFPYLATWGIGPDTTVEQLIAIVVAAAFTAVLTYFVPNKPVTE
jgi:hypothetical protein